MVVGIQPKVNGLILAISNQIFSLASHGKGKTGLKPRISEGNQG
jgi:hypothetical protein